MEKQSLTTLNEGRDQTSQVVRAEDPNSDMIGVVETVTGGVIVTRADGVEQGLRLGDFVYQGDKLTTADDGSVGVRFADQSIIALNENGEIVLDEMVYDPDSATGSALFSLLSGGAMFVSGQIAKLNPDAMTVQTPTATIGIRGTKFFMTQSETQLALVNLPEETLQGQTVGEILVYDHAGALLNSIDKYGLGLKWDPSIQVVPATQQMTESYVIWVLARGRRILPKTNDEMALEALEASQEASRKAEMLIGRAEMLEQRAAAIAEKGDDTATAEANRAAAKAKLQAQQAIEKARAAEEEAIKAIQEAESDMGFKANEHMLKDGESADISGQGRLLIDQQFDQGMLEGFGADRFVESEHAQPHSGVLLSPSPRPDAEFRTYIEEGLAATESYSVSPGFTEGYVFGMNDKNDLIG